MNAANKTQKAIVDYLRAHTQDGKLTKSLVDIGKDVGFSNATIHRALNALEEKGIIEVAPAKKKSEPNTILYKGEKTDLDEFIAEGVKLAKEASDMAERMNDYVRRSETLIRSLRRQNELLKVDNVKLNTQEDEQRES